MEDVEIKRWKQEPIDLNIAYVPLPDTFVSPGVTECVKAISSGPKRPVDLGNRPESAAHTPLNSNQVGLTTDAEMAEHSNRKGLTRSQKFATANHTVLSLSSQHPKRLASARSLKLAPGTSVYYTPRRSITCKRYVNACTLEALSLLADVSCSVKRTHLQRACNLSPRLSESKRQVKSCTVEALCLLADVSCEVMKRTHTQQSMCNQTPKPSGNGANMRFNRMPLQKKMASVLRNLNQLKEQCADHNSQKVTDSFGVVRKLRTPRRPSLPAAFRCPTKLRKNISLSECDEIFSHKWELGGASLADTVRLRGPLAVTDTSVFAFETNKNIMLGEGELLDGKPISNIGSVPLDCQRTTTLERVSKYSCQIRGTKKKSFGGIRRTERYTNKILQFIGEVSVPEKIIRDTLGNNPDTSKALRLLLSERKVKRFNLGGRGRPFQYVATERGLLHIHKVKQALSAGVELSPERVSPCDPITGPTTASDTPTSEAQCLPTHGTKSGPGVSVSETNDSRLYSVTPHCCIEWQSAQTLNCVLSSQSLEFPSSGITEC